MKFFILEFFECYGVDIGGGGDYRQNGVIFQAFHRNS